MRSNNGNEHWIAQQICEEREVTNSGKAHWQPAKGGEK